MRDRNGCSLVPGDAVFICRNLQYGHVKGYRYGDGNGRPDQVIIDLGEWMPGVPVLRSIEPWEVEKIMIAEVEQCK